MGWSGRAARRLHRTITAMIANHSDTISEVKRSTEPFTAGAVLAEETFLDHDVASARHMAARLVLDEDVKPRENMTTATLLARVAKWRKAGAADAAAAGGVFPAPIIKTLAVGNPVAPRNPRLVVFSPAAALNSHTQ